MRTHKSNEKTIDFRINFRKTWDLFLCQCIYLLISSNFIVARNVHNDLYLFRLLTSTGNENVCFFFALQNNSKKWKTVSFVLLNKKKRRENLISSLFQRHFHPNNFRFGCVCEFTFVVVVVKQRTRRGRIWKCLNLDELVQFQL